MLSDELSSAMHVIEKYEKDFSNIYEDLADDLRKIKSEMIILRWRLDLLPPIEEAITPADLQWLKTEAWKRGLQRPPFEFSDVFEECLSDVRTCRSNQPFCSLPSNTRTTPTQLPTMPVTRSWAPLGNSVIT